MGYYLDGRHRIRGRRKIVSLYAGTRRGLPHVTQQVENAWVIEETYSTIEWRHGGVLLKEGGTSWDCYGFMNSVPSAVEDAERFCKDYQVTPASSLVCCVRVRVSTILLHEKPMSEFTALCHDYVERQIHEAVAEFIAWDSRRGWRIPREVIERYAANFRTLRAKERAR